MQNTYYEHPSEEALERFLLNQCQAEELDTVETHILACEPCVARLESLEVEIAAMKLALQNMQSELAAKAAKRAESSWRNWFSVPTLSMAGAVAALALGILVIPQIRTSMAKPTEVTLSAYRGMETSAVPKDKLLRLHLNAAGLPEEPVSIQVVGENGAQLWKGSSVVRGNDASVTIPRLTASGNYFVRLYGATAGAQTDLLREFAFQVK